MKSVPLSRANTLIPFVAFLDEVGVPVEQGLVRSHLPPQLLENPGCYMTTLANWAFIGRMAGEHGIEDLGLRIGNDRGPELMGAALTAGVSRAPTLLQGLRNFRNLCRRESSGMRTWLSPDPSGRRFRLHKTFDIDTPGYHQTEWLGLMAMTTAVRLFAGRAWQPRTISLKSAERVPRLAREVFPNARILIHQPAAFVTVPTSLLGSSARSVWCPDVRPSRQRPGEIAPNAPAEDFAGALGQALQLYLEGGYARIELAADITGMSVRSLQRELAGAGFSYSALLDRARFERASQLLRETDATSQEVAHASGYTDPSNFARAFRRLAGVSPRQYRAHQQSANASRSNGR